MSLSLTDVEPRWAVVVETADLHRDHWVVALRADRVSPGISAEVQHLYLAQGLTPVDRGDFELHHEEADMTTEWVPFEDRHDAVVAGRLTDRVGPVWAAPQAAARREERREDRRPEGSQEP